MGLERSGQTGRGGAGAIYPTAVPVVDRRGLPLTNCIAVAAGEAHSAALRADGLVFAWGAGDDGQLGDLISGAGHERRFAGPMLLETTLAAPPLAVLLDVDRRAVFS